MVEGSAWNQEQAFFWVWWSLSNFLGFSRARGRCQEALDADTLKKGMYLARACCDVGTHLLIHWEWISFTWSCCSVPLRRSPCPLHPTLTISLPLPVMACHLLSVPPPSALLYVWQDRPRKAWTQTAHLQLYPSKLLCANLSSHRHPGGTHQDG